MDRREFLRLSALAGVGCLSAAPPRRAVAGPPGDDYRALVIIMLNGGNDAFSMLLPAGADAFAAYAAPRGDLAVARMPLASPPARLLAGANPYAAGEAGDNAAAYRAGYYPVAGQPIGVNGVMPELARLLEAGGAKAVLGAGNLVRPVDRQQIEDGAAALPLFMFAHNHQRRQLELGRADRLTGPGWAGRLADLWSGAGDGTGALGLNVSFAGTSHLMAGEMTSPLIIPAAGPTVFEPFAVEGPIDTGRERLHGNRRALYQFLMGEAQAPRFADGGAPAPQDYRDLAAYVPDNLFERATQRVGNRSLAVLERLSEDWQDTLSRTHYVSADSYGNTGSDLFAIPQAAELQLEVSGVFGAFIAQLEAIATMMKLASEQGCRRQIFLARLNGFDTHSNQAAAHPVLLRELSLGLDKFQKAVADLGLADRVLALTQSDFGRTVSINGDGTDHGWAGHQLVVGGGMRTSAVVGTLPDLALGSDDDYADKGRIIPAIGNEQVTATALRWFGAAPAELAALFPNLAHFASVPADVETALLGDLLA